MVTIFMADLGDFFLAVQELASKMLVNLKFD
jgi:hypothetical protein